MSIECGECEHDLRGGHDPSCSRNRPNDEAPDSDKAPSQPAPKRVGATSESIALVANNNGRGCVLVHHGYSIDHFIDAVSASLDDAGLDDGPEGLSIWEGTVKSYDLPEGDHDAALVGKFRPLTLEEWARLAATGIPWSFERQPGEDPLAEVPRLPSRQYVPTDEQRHNDGTLRTLHDLGATESQVIEALVAKCNRLEMEAQFRAERELPTLHFHVTPKEAARAAAAVVGGVDLEPCAMNELGKP